MQLCAKHNVSNPNDVCYVSSLNPNYVHDASSPNPNDVWWVLRGIQGVQATCEKISIFEKINILKKNKNMKNY